MTTFEHRTVGPVVAGSWYPADAEALALQVDALLGAAPAPGGGTPPPALIAPHAGFAYSGAVAAAGFRSLLGARFDRVIVIGPSHYAGFRGAAVPDADACATPLGGIPLDAPAVARLLGAPGFRRDNVPFAREHCLEAELPFLQRTLRSGFRLVPVLVGSGTVGAVADQVAAGLAPLCDPATLVVVSSDFTHYGAAFGYVPFRERVPDRIRELDFGVVERILSGDAVAFEAYLERTGATVCGRDAIGVLLRLLAPGSAADLLAYDTSGRMTGDWSHTVSYAAIAFRGARA